MARVVMVFTDEEIGDAEVLRIEQAPRNFAELEVAERRAADEVIRAKWRAMGGRGEGARPATPLRGSTCARCGATDTVLGSASAGSDYYCAFGCA